VDAVPGCLHHIVAARAAERPGAVAVDAGRTVLSYAQLDAAADHLAGRLSGLGAGTDRVVALYGRLCPELVVAVLAVLKSGAAFLPLDPGDPAARTRAVLAAAAPPVLLTTPEWQAQASGLGAPALVLSGGTLTARGEPAGRGGRPTDLAYVLFTSGSTGQPKGVLVEHRNIVNYCRWVARANRVAGAVAVLPALTRFTFDAAMQQLLAPLTRGDPVWLVPDEVRAAPERLLALLRDRPGAGLHCVPTLWAELLEVVEASGGAPALSCVFLGGERVRPDLWERTRLAFPDTRLANVYGPTEATVQATGGFQPAGTPLHAGHPVDGVRIHLLDAAGRPAAPGAEGEVVIGGAGVARGYLGDAALTAQRFRDGAEYGLPPGRVYRTGDLGRLLPDGALEVLGRLDDQVKVRGYRVEPAEIESVLAGHPGVRAAAVVVPGSGAAAGALCAAVVAGPARPAGTDLLAELRQLAAERLPPYMQPARWQLAPALPRAASGKLDRRGIAAGFAAAAAAGPPPRTAAEQVVAGVWAQVLGRPVRSADDDFFALGGHSLNATRVAARLRAAFGVPTALRILFEQRTVRAVARALAAAGTVPPPPPNPEPPAASPATAEAANAERANPPPTRPESATAEPAGPVPLSAQQEAIWVTERLLAGVPFNTMVLPVLVSGPLDTAALHRSVRRLVAAHPALRTRFAEVAGEPVQSVAEAADPPFTEVDLGKLEPTAQARAALRRARAFHAEPFDLAGGPPVRVRLLRLGPERSVILFGTHHLVCDGISLQVIMEDLIAGLRDPAATVAGRPGYAAYAVRQQQRLQAGRYDADLAYWAGKVAEPAAPLPTAPPGSSPGGNDPGGNGTGGNGTGGNGTGAGTPERFRFGTATAAIGEALAGRLGAFSRQHGATPFLGIAAAMAALLHLRGGGSPVRLGTLAANRGGAEFARTVGPFATTLVLSVPVTGAATYHQLVGMARADLLDSYQHQEMPLELALADSGGPAPGPPFRVGLAFEPARPAEVVGRTRFEVYPAADGAGLLPVLPSSTDLSVTVAERGPELVGTLEYRRSLLDGDGAAGFLAELYRLLDHQLARPDRPLAELAADLADR
jgi:amino acid adenylation domain-containing protein